MLDVTELGSQFTASRTMFLLEILQNCMQFGKRDSTYLSHIPSPFCGHNGQAQSSYLVQELAIESNHAGRQ